MNAFEEKKQARIDRYNALAAKAGQRSNELITQSHDMLSVIPLGQPILVGHYSEKGDRNYRGRIENKFRQGMAESDKAEYYAQKAEAAENNNAISSDDPDAVEKLEHKLEALQREQEDMKQMNAYFRKHSTMKGYPGLHDDEAARIDARIEKAYSWEKKPCPSYLLQNNNQNINRIEKRIAELKSKASFSDGGWDFDGGKVVMNTEDNRIQIFFDGKPDEEIRKELKYHGFRWAPSVKAWQRQLTGNGLFALKQIKSIRPDTHEPCDKTESAV